LLSLPPSFRQLLHLVLQLQEKVGEHLLVPVPQLLEYFQEQGTYVSHARWKPFIQELTSNRVALHDTTRNGVIVLQLGVVRQVLHELMDGSSVLDPT
jgi:hypothetical protein